MKEKKVFSKILGTLATLIFLGVFYVQIVDTMDVGFSFIDIFKFIPGIVFISLSWYLILKDNNEEAM
ncbi:MAG: hypothetical protein WCW35_11820 [Bacteroidota bacterium]|jgi:hypothetical protein